LPTRTPYIVTNTCDTIATTLCLATIREAHREEGDIISLVTTFRVIQGQMGRHNTYIDRQQAKLISSFYLFFKMREVG
jgi:hypothetical protein